MQWQAPEIPHHITSSRTHRGYFQLPFNRSICQEPVFCSPLNSGLTAS
jgi:hypothetical protein